MIVCQGERCQTAAGCQCNVHGIVPYTPVLTPCVPVQAWESRWDKIRRLQREISDRQITLHALILGDQSIGVGLCNTWSIPDGQSNTHG